MMWKIVGLSEVSVIYIYIYIDYRKTTAYALKFQEGNFFY